MLLAMWAPSAQIHPEADRRHPLGQGDVAVGGAGSRWSFPAHALGGAADQLHQVGIVHIPFVGPVAHQFHIHLHPMLR